jgi:hypothetical protein
MFITFSYKIGNSRDIFCGKYVFDYISDDHEGLDLEVKNILYNGLNEYRKSREMGPLKKNIQVAVISFSDNNNVPTYSSIEETKCFDFYAVYYDYTATYYVNGKKIEQ